MSGNRKLLMFFGQLIASAALVGLGKMGGVEFVSLQTLAIPVFVAGNFGEHFSRKGNVNANPPAV